MNLAVTVLFPDIVTIQIVLSLLEHPVQPEKTYPILGIAVRVAVVPTLYVLVFPVIIPPMLD